jgi:hypothetical protein
MNTETATNIQTFAAIAQGIAALVFLVGVVLDAKSRRRERQRRSSLVEQGSRDNLVTSLRQLWVQRYVEGFIVSMTDEELAGFHSERQIAFYNQQLEERGFTWRYPYERVE